MSIDWNKAKEAARAKDRAQYASMKASTQARRDVLLDTVVETAKKRGKTARDNDRSVTKAPGKKIFDENLLSSAQGYWPTQRVGDTRGPIGSMTTGGMLVNPRTEELNRFLDVHDDKVYKDGFGGQFSANYALGRANNEASKAWAIYMDDPTEENRKIAEGWDSVARNLRANNKAPLDEQGEVLPWVSRTLASNLPQTVDQTLAQGVGGLVGAGLAGAAGAKIGASVASGAQSYDAMRGAAFKRMLDLGVDEETARDLATDEGIINAVIEGGDTYLDWFLLGTGGAVKKLLPGLASKATTAVGKSAIGRAVAAIGKNVDKVPRAARAVGGWALNIPQEGGEEGWQEGVSLAVDKAALSGQAPDLWDLMKSSVKEALAPENREQVLEASKDGMKYAAMLGGGQALVSHGLGKLAQNGAQGVPGQNKTAPEVGAVYENGLNAFSEQERVNLSSGKKNKVISTFSEAVSFVKNALSDRQNVDRAYLGKVPDAVAQKVLAETGINISGYSAVIPGDSVRHMFKRHGDPIAEAALGQIPLTPEIAAKIPEILAAPDRITISEKTDANGRPALLFEKSIGDRYVTVQAVSNGTHSIQTDTLYIRKKTPQDTVSNAGADTQALNRNVQNVPPQGSFIDSTIPQNAEPVNSVDPLLSPENDGLGAANAGFLGDSERGFSKNITTDEGMAPELRESFQDDPEMYFRLGNKETLAKAQAIFDGGLESARSTLERALGAAQSGMKLPPEMVPLSRMVANELTRQGDWYSARKILSDVSVELTEAGQLGQAAVILRDTGHAGKVMTVEKLVERAKQALSADGLDIQVEDGLFQAYADAQTDAEQDAAIGAIQQRIAEQVPSTLLEKWTALRYVNMLGNFKTQVRNVTGNVGMALVSRAKNTVAAALETVADKASGGRLGRTKSVLVGRSLLNAAKADFANVRKSALGEGKFSIDSPTANDFVQGIKDRQRVFKFAPAEGYRKATNWAMNNQYFGDEAFVRAAYARALGGYLKANGITAEQFGSEAWREKHTDIVDKARSYAVKEAQETTFRDHNALSDWVSRIGRRPDTPKPVQALSAGMMPFRRTPANVLARAEEYSPLGLLNTAYMGAKKALSATSATQSRGLIGEAARSGGEVSGTDIINSLSKALTGTGLFALGMYLKSLGMIRGGADDDEKQAAFDDLTGHQNYALELPNGLSVTIDWLSPTAMPLFMGAQLEQLREDGGIDLKDIESALTSLADPMIEMSMMQGINDAVDDLKFSDNNLIQLAISSSLSYLTQGLTNTLVGQIRHAYSGENTMTYVDKNSPIPDWLQRELGSASKKSVFPAFQQIPYLDAWGREEETGDVLERSINSLFNPAYVSQVDVDKVERELQRVKDATGDGGVFPQRAGRSIEFDGETHDLTAEQYQKYARAKGRSSYSLVSDAINSAAYRAMGSGDRAEFVKKMYGYADYQAKRSVFPSYHNDAYARYEEAEAAGITPQEFYIYKENTAGLTADKDSNGESIPGSKKSKVINAISRMTLSPTEKDWLYLLNYNGKNAQSDLQEMPWNR